MLYQIIDCTTSIGCACHVRGAFRAHLRAMWLTLMTRRFHDYVAATPHSLHWDRYVNGRA